MKRLLPICPCGDMTLTRGQTKCAMCRAEAEDDILREKAEEARALDAEAADYAALRAGEVRP